MSIQGTDKLPRLIPVLRGGYFFLPPPTLAVGCAAKLATNCTTKWTILNTPAV